MNITNAPLTYKLDRKCLNCCKPIADLEHAARQFCEKYYDQNGKVHDCKTEYHSDKNKPAREIHGNIIRDQKFYAKQILTMVSKKGYEVTTDDLNAYDIILTHSLSLEIKNDGKAVSRFLNYTIISNPDSNKHKITINEQQ